ncbi:unnamed protein product, partial [Sphagnum jensenii]
MIQYVSYKDETQLETIMSLIDQELSEPYSIFTYRYFITLWPDLCFMAFNGDKCVGTIVSTELVTRCIQVMHDSGCDEVTLEAEVTNKGALALYGNLGFIRAKHLHRYYLNGVDAFRLKLLFPRPPDPNNLFALAGVGHDHGH